MERAQPKAPIGMAADAGALERMFKLQENGTNVRTEVIAGLTTFVTMAYILFVNPSILSASGMDQGALFTATALAAALATLFMGLYANYPFALAPGMGLNAFFAFVLTNPQAMNVPWPTALGIVFLSGLLATVVTLTGLRELMIRAIPVEMKHAVSAGIGLFIALIGLKNAGIVTAFEPTLVALGDMRNPAVLVAVVGLVITAVLVARRATGGILLGVLATTAIAIAFGQAPVPTSLVSAPPSLAPSLFKLDLAGALKASFITTIFALFFADLFDTIGTFVGVAARTGMIDERGNLKRGNKALFADSLGTVIGSLLGTSNTTTYVESAAGVSAGGRTGLTSVVVAGLFLLSLFLAPLAGAVPGVATAPALVIVGILMAGSLREIDWSDFVIAFPALLTVVMMPFTFSIAKGLALGFVGYALIMLLSGRARQVHPVMYGLALLFAIFFGFGIVA